MFVIFPIEITHFLPQLLLFCAKGACVVLKKGISNKFKKTTLFYTKNFEVYSKVQKSMEIIRLTPYTGTPHG